MCPSTDKSRPESNALSKRSAPKGLRSDRLKTSLPISPPEPIKGLAFVYILQSADGTYYVGHSVNVQERLRKHRLGIGSKHTHDHPLIVLVHVEGPFIPADAVRREFQLKRWSRAKKDALILGNFEKLHDLSRSKESDRRPRHQTKNELRDWPTPSED
jgi:putative endonuclease